MASRMILLAAIMVVGVAIPAAECQLLGLIRINGTVPCGVNIPTSTAITSVFPNAAVQLQYGGTVLSSTTTDSAGVFTMFLNPVSTLLSSLLSNCNLVVNTPLSTCNSALPLGGILQSPLQLLTGTIPGLLGGITDIIPGGFSLVH
ncbi:putative phylloplanin [Dioscorea sansibarensis]